MGEEALFEVEPHALDRVQLGRVGRQRHERDVVWRDEGTRAMPAGPIEHHDDVLIGGDGCREAIEKLLHRLRVHVRQNKREGVVCAGLDGCEDVGEREAFVAEARRPLTTLSPNVTGRALLSDARLVLKEQADALILVRTLNSPQQSWGSF